MHEFDYQGHKFFSGVLSTNRNIPDEMNYIVAMKSAMMHIKKLDEHRFQGENYEGMITTEHKYVLIGTLGGIEYKCRVDVDDVSADIRFILREQGPWFTELN
jgi:hypothetical protein